jgi:hypothetical protein
LDLKALTFLLQDLAAENYGERTSNSFLRLSIWAGKDVFPGGHRIENSEMNDRLFIGIDSGTQGTKGVV